MRVQWQLRNVETGEVLAELGHPFDLDIEGVLQKWEDHIVRGAGGSTPIGIIEATKKEKRGDQ